mgnify:CR=1 FL=1
MKSLYVIIFLVINLSAYAATPRNTYKYPTNENEVSLNTINQSSVMIYRQLSSLQKIKLLILNGEIDKADILLNASRSSEDYNKKILEDLDIRLLCLSYPPQQFG